MKIEPGFGDFAVAVRCGACRSVYLLRVEAADEYRAMRLGEFLMDKRAGRLAGLVSSDPADQAKAVGVLRWGKRTVAQVVEKLDVGRLVI